MVKNAILKYLSHVLNRDLTHYEELPDFSKEELKILQADPSILDEIYSEILNVQAVSSPEPSPQPKELPRFCTVQPVTEYDVLTSMIIDEGEGIGPAEKEGTSTKRIFKVRPHEIKRDWLVVDATDKVLGRLASEIARRLRGKIKSAFQPHVDTGGYVVIVNVEKLRVTGDNLEERNIVRSAGIPAGINEINAAKDPPHFPARVLEKAVKGMLPKGPLGYAMLKKMKCYTGSQHSYTELHPKEFKIVDTVTPGQGNMKLQKPKHTLTSQGIKSKRSRTARYIAKHT